jgi:hypothetical protein
VRLKFFGFSGQLTDRRDCLGHQPLGWWPKPVSGVSGALAAGTIGKYDEDLSTF